MSLQFRAESMDFPVSARSSDRSSVNLSQESFDLERSHRQNDARGRALQPLENPVEFGKIEFIDSSVVNSINKHVNLEHHSKASIGGGEDFSAGNDQRFEIMALKVHDGDKIYEYGGIDWEIAEAKRGKQKYKESFQDGARMFETTTKDGTHIKIVEGLDGTRSRTETHKDGSYTRETSYSNGVTTIVSVDSQGRRTQVTRIPTPFGECTITENPDGSTDIVDGQGGRHHIKSGERFRILR